MRPTRLMLLAAALLTLAVASPAWADHDSDFKSGMSLTFQQQNPEGAVNSDLAFWGKRAYAADYGGFRIFDISNPDQPSLVSDFRCYGPQNDLSVWDRDGDGRADLLITSVDRTLTGSQCGATATARNDDPTGWEGLRLFDISNEAAPVQIGSVYQDCGSHTHTVIPQADRLLVLNSSYPLRGGPTCGDPRGVEAGRDPLHGVVQVVEVPLADPAAAREIRELPIEYPGDPDNKFDPQSRGFPAEAAGEPFGDLRACHDMTVFVPLGLVGAACAEQLQLWRIGADGLPDTENPVWVYDQPNVDFWHSATFSWDGKVLNGIDESFGSGCPTTTTLPDGSVVESGNMFFMDTASGAKLSEFRMPRSDPHDHIAQYCSAHLGNVVPMVGRYLLVNAWYTGGVDVIDFSNPRAPREIAYYDDDGDNWSAYWYEHHNAQTSPLRIYASDGVEAPAHGDGFQAFNAAVRGHRFGMARLNPQTQEHLIRSTTPRARRQAQGRTRKASGTRKASRRTRARRAAPRARRSSVSASRIAHLAP